MDIILHLCFTIWDLNMIITNKINTYNNDFGAING